MLGKEYFCVSVSKYISDKQFNVFRPASLDNPKDNAVMFITEKNIDSADVFNTVFNCLVFWPITIHVPAAMKLNHAVYECQEPRLQFCKFFADNQIKHNPPNDEYEQVNGSFIAKSAKFGANVQLFPGVYIGGEVEIGNNVYIGSGTKIVGKVTIGDDVVIRENSVLGADGLSTDRDENGHAVTLPQFGGIIIEDNVQIGALSVIARGAIDDTIICRGSKIDNSSFISHNVQIGEDTFIVGESIMFGSSSTGVRVLISGNSTIRNGIRIGNEAVVGMGSVVVKPVPDNSVVKGNPAK